MSTNITFRTQLIGGVTEFCQESRLNFLSNALHLVELIVLLARYTEEGDSLYPKVYLTDDRRSMTSMLPDGELVKIGQASANVEGVKSAIKKCAPLAINGWLIYIEATESNLEYGLFKGSGNPISVLVDDVLMSQNDNSIVVKASQVAADCVEIRSSTGGLHYIFLNHRREDSAPPLQYIDQLIESITNNVSPVNKEPTTSLLNKLITPALRQSHGCIIAVTDQRSVPEYLGNDGIILDEPIDFPFLVSEFKKDILSASHIDSKGHLLGGMLNSDGIILFDNKGRLLGYNCFIKVDNKEQVNGGARKRAFASLKSKIGQGLSAAFIQSQDGWTDFEDCNDE